MRWMSCNMKASLPWQWCQVINILRCWKSISVFITQWTQKSKCSSDKGPIEKLRHKFFAEQIFIVHMTFIVLSEQGNSRQIIELSNCPAVLASIALFQWDWNQDTLFFSHDSKGSVPFNSKTAHPPGIPRHLTGVSLHTMRKLTHKWGLPGWAFDFHVKMLVSITNKRIS